MSFQPVFRFCSTLLFISALGFTAKASECREIRFCDSEENCTLTGYVKTVEQTETFGLFEDEHACRRELVEHIKPNSRTVYTCVEREDICERGAHYLRVRDGLISSFLNIGCKGWELTSESEEIFWIASYRDALTMCERFAPIILQPDDAI